MKIPVTTFHHDRLPLARVLVLILAGAFVGLMVDIRVEHVDVVHQRPIAWMPIIYAGFMTIACLVAFVRWDKAARYIMIVLFLVAFVIGNLGFYLHNHGHILEVIKTSVSAWTSDAAPAVRMAINCAIVAFTIIAMQFLLTARFRWIEAPFGLDVVLRFHQGMALVSICLLCAHPLLLASMQGWGLLTRWGARWPIWAGRFALLLLLAHGAFGVGRRALRLRYETWLFVHNVAASLVLGLALVHSLAVGRDFANAGPQRIVWIALPLIAWSAWFHRRIARPYVLARWPYKVLAIYSETPAVWTLTLEPPVGKVLDFAPGQFQFLRPLTGSVPAEEHPSPSRPPLHPTAESA